MTHLLLYYQVISSRLNSRDRINYFAHTCVALRSDGCAERIFNSSNDGAKCKKDRLVFLGDSFKVFSVMSLTLRSRPEQQVADRYLHTIRVLFYIYRCGLHRFSLWSLTVHAPFAISLSLVFGFLILRAYFVTRTICFANTAYHRKNINCNRSLFTFFVGTLIFDIFNLFFQSNNPNNQLFLIT